MSDYPDFSVFQEDRKITPVDWEFGEMLLRHTKATPKEPWKKEALRLLAAVTRAAVGQSHSCLDLAKWKESAEYPSPFSPEDWQKIAQEFSDEVSFSDSKLAPLFFDSEHKLVYLYKYKLYETELANLIKQKVGNGKTDAGEVTKEEVKDISQYFKDDYENDKQQQAVYQALQSGLFIVTGGPGTGKTTVMTAILALELNRKPELNIALCAPTGKAAARMKEAIVKEVGGTLNASDDVKSILRNLTPVTLHSLLEINQETGRPKYNKEKTLPFDLLVADESSMTALQLFRQLLCALKPDCRLLLLGDRDQLASVESGVVFADLCESELMSKNKVTLDKNHRSKENEELCKFVQGIVGIGKKPDVDKLYRKSEPKFSAEDMKGKALDELVSSFMAEKLGDDCLKQWKEVKSVDDAMKMADRFKILCALREGATGVKSANDMMLKLLKIKLYGNGMPIIIMKNDNVTGLRNGDVGVCFDKRAYFKTGVSGDSSKSFTFAQLPPHEPAFAMTVHKSQGSDYENVIMILPNENNPVLTKELVYTGITRTRQNFLLLSSKEILEDAMKNTVSRWSGLKNLLDQDVSCE